MKQINKIITAFLLLQMAFYFSSTAQSIDTCYLHISSNWFYKCKSTIAYNGMSLLNVKGIAGTRWLIDCDVYNSSGVKLVTLKNGEVTTGDSQPISISSTADEFILKLAKTNVELIHLKKYYSEKYKHSAVDVWLQFYLPDGNFVQCTPETSNIPTMQYIKGSLFNGVGSAIEID